MDDRQRRFLKDKLEDAAQKQPGMLEMRDKLLAIGGEQIVANFEPDLRLLLSREHIMQGRTKMMKGKPISCHQNVINMLDDGVDVQAATGYALINADGLWRQHSWGVLGDGTIVETTMLRTMYWGVILRGEEATNFCDLNRRASRVAARFLGGGRKVVPDTLA